MKAKRRRAFTLIELLVCIAIITVLMALLFPSLGKARESGLSISCMSNLRQSGVAAMSYAGDNREILTVSNEHSPSWAGFLIPPDGAKYGNQSFGDDYLNARSANCPKAGYVNPAETNGLRKNFYGSAIPEPNAIASRFKWGPNLLFYAMPLRDVLLPSRSVLLGDTTFEDAAKRRQDSSYFMMLRGHELTVCVTTLLRHSSCANILFMDGHVKALKLGDFQSSSLYYQLMRQSYYETGQNGWAASRARFSAVLLPGDMQNPVSWTPAPVPSSP